ncbi:MAG: hypothetical protein U0694_02190 [Anaerolineae bacterium]
MSSGEDVLNHSRITTVVVCAVTSNAKKASVRAVCCWKRAGEPATSKHRRGCQSVDGGENAA